jgi:hypothetical protein
VLPRRRKRRPRMAGMPLERNPKSAERFSDKLRDN